jgi:hypothetical protein
MLYPILVSTEVVEKTMGFISTNTGKNRVHFSEIHPVWELLVNLLLDTRSKVGY